MTKKYIKKALRSAKIKTQIIKKRFSRIKSLILLVNLNILWKNIKSLGLFNKTSVWGANLLKINNTIKLETK